jgi:hypothetical protein
MRETCSAIFAWLIVISCVIFGQPLSARITVETGNDLLSECDNTGTDMIFCSGRLNGFMLGLEMAGQDKQVFCRPPSTNVGQAGDIVMKYVKDHPDRRHADWRILSVLAFNDAWPCVGGPSVIWEPETSTIRLAPQKQ